MKIFADKEILLVLSGLFTDLAAGWLAAILIGPFVVQTSIPEFVKFLTINICAATLSLVLAVNLAKMAKRL